MDYVMTKEEARKFLRICKSTGFIKFNTFLKDKNISQSAFSRYLNDDNYDMISELKIVTVADELYNSASFLKAMYEELENKVA